MADVPLSQGFFALSSDTEFRPVPSLGGFCYKAFYDDLKQRLEKETPERINALLSWWNAYVAVILTGTALICPQPHVYAAASARHEPPTGYQKHGRAAHGAGRAG